MTESTQMGHIHPTEEQVAALAAAAEVDQGPIVMTNLLRFDAEGGRERYRRYSVEVQAHLDRVGATVIYAGDARQTVIGADDDTWWDAILLVRYPSRAKFLEMVSDPGYQAIGGYRTAALTNSALIATDPWPTGP